MVLDGDFFVLDVFLVDFLALVPSYPLYGSIMVSWSLDMCVSKIQLGGYDLRPFYILNGVDRSEWVPGGSWGSEMVSSSAEPLFLHFKIGRWDFRSLVVVMILNFDFIWVPRVFTRFCRGFPKIVVDVWNSMVIKFVWCIWMFFGCLWVSVCSSGLNWCGFHDGSIVWFYNGFLKLEHVCL